VLELRAKRGHPCTYAKVQESSEMELYPKPPRHENWVITCPKSPHTPFKIARLDIIFRLLNCFDKLLCHQIFLNPLPKSDGTVSIMGRSAHAVKLSGILFRNALSGFEGKPGNELLGSDKSRLHGRPSFGVEFALRRIDVPSKQFLELIERWDWMFLANFVAYRHSLLLDEETIKLI
jgi:hypothetical protein